MNVLEKEVDKVILQISHSPKSKGEIFTKEHDRN